MSRKELTPDEIAALFATNCDDESDDNDGDDGDSLDKLLEYLDNDYDKEDYQYFMRPLNKEDKKNMNNKLRRLFDEKNRIDTDGVSLYSNLGAVINKLKELSYFDIDIEEIPLRIDDIKKTYYKVKVSAAPDKKLSQREIDILVRSLCPRNK
jgi:hypothetical protein